MTTALEQQPITADSSSEPAPQDVDVLTPTYPRPRVRRRTLWDDIRETIIMVLAIYTAVNLIAPRYIVDGISMEPNFHTGEWIIVGRLPYLLHPPQRGDVVILDFPEPQEDLIKRMIGLPGETISIHDGLVYVNGVPLEEPYINEPPHYHGEWVLGPNEYFVLGDNRNNSRDSHVFGPITADHLIGQAWLIYWPPQYWGFVPHYGYDHPPVLTLTPTPTPVIPTATPAPPTFMPTPMPPSP